MQPNRGGLGIALNIELALADINKAPVRWRQAQGGRGWQMASEPLPCLLRNLLRILGRFSLHPLAGEHPWQLLRQHVRLGSRYQGGCAQALQARQPIRPKGCGIGHTVGVTSAEQAHRLPVQAVDGVEVAADPPCVVAQVPREIPVLIDDARPQAG